MLDEIELNVRAMSYEPTDAEYSTALGVLDQNPNFDDGQTRFGQGTPVARSPLTFAAANVVAARRGGPMPVYEGSREDIAGEPVLSMTLSKLARYLLSGEESETEGEDYASNSVNLPWWVTLPAALLLVVGIVFVGLFAAGTIDLGDYRFMGMTGAVLVTLGNLFLTFRIFHYPLLIVIGFIIAITGLVLWSLALANRP